MADGVTNNAFAAARKLPVRPAASKDNSAFSGGRRLIGIPIHELISPVA